MLHKQNFSPRVSIVCVCYNQRDIIEKTIRGFLMQKSDFEYEIIIGDDASTDGTADIIKDFFKNHPKLITPIFRNQNSGGRDNLLSVLGKVRGDFVAYCEGDDYWIDEFKLQKQYDAINANQDVSLVWTDINIFNESSEKLIKSAYANNYLPIYSEFEDVLINKPFFAPSTWFFRSSYISYFGNNLYVDGTFPFILDLMQISRILHLPVVTGVYTRKIESVTNSRSHLKRYYFAKSVFDIQIDYSQKVNFELRELIIQKHYRSLLSYALLANDKEFIQNAKDLLQKPYGMRIRYLFLFSRSYFLRLVHRKFFNILKYIQAKFK